MSIIRNFIAKQLFKKGGAIANSKAVDFSTNALIKRLNNYNIKPTDITSEDQLLRVLNSVKQAEDNVFSNKFKGMMENNKFFNRQSDNVVDLKNKKLDTKKPILGGMQETDEQILQRLKKQNEDSLNRLKNKKEPPEELAGGGVAGLLGERPGYNKGLKVQGSLNPPAPKNVSLLDFIKVNASGTKSGKNQIEGAADGITIDNESINAIIKADIPISQKIDLIAEYKYGKDRDRIENKDQEIFLGEGGYKDRDIGFGYNQGGEGISGSVMRDLKTGDDEFKINFKKNIDFNKLFNKMFK